MSKLFAKASPVTKVSSTSNTINNNFINHSKGSKNANKNFNNKKDKSHNTDDLVCRCPLSPNHFRNTVNFSYIDDDADEEQQHNNGFESLNSSDLEGNDSIKYRNSINSIDDSIISKWT